MREGLAIHALFGYANHAPRGLLLGVQLTFLGLIVAAPSQEKNKTKI